jgi:hypothetical protein
MARLLELRVGDVAHAAAARSIAGRRVVYPLVAARLIRRSVAE